MEFPTVSEIWYRFRSLGLRSNNLSGVISDPIGDFIASLPYQPPRISGNAFLCPYPTALVEYFSSINEDCSADSDEDGVADSVDAFPLDSTESFDTDADGVGDNADVFPFDANESADFDGDGLGDNADLDDDGDTIADLDEDFPRNRFALTRWGSRLSDYSPVLM